ncbi:MAG TPA: DUF4202 domain-containing protein, partial [Cellvibrionaceae bacterium]
LLYAQRMTKTLLAFASNASQALQLAARAQHIERWTSLRSNYPEGRTGYKQWRSELMLYHARRAGELMTIAGAEASEIARVQYLIQKRSMSRDAETQCLEDVICLVFIEYHLADFAAKSGYDEAKLIDIIQKTWVKMSPEGQAAALQLPLASDVAAVIGKALAPN